MPRAKRPTFADYGRLGGLKGGKSKSDAKAAAARKNGQKGGWPKGKKRAPRFDLMSNAAWREWAKAQPSYLGHKAKPAFSAELDAEIIALIRKNHLKANISDAEEDAESSIIHWDEAWVDPGGTIFGPPDAPYLKVPVTSRLFSDADKLPRRVYATARLRPKLVRMITEASEAAKGKRRKGKRNG